MTVPLYEHPAWQQAPERVMRPGGIEITERAMSHCDLRPGSRVLDLGCGMGTALKEIGAGRDWKTCGLDISMQLLRQAHHTSPETAFTQARAEQMPLAGESLDAILAECTLSIMETDATLQECSRVLKRGGYLVVNDVYARNASGMEALRKLPPGTCIGSAMTQEQILERLSRGGFCLIGWQDCSEILKEFSVCALTEAATVDPFDLYIAAARAKLGYYFLVALKTGGDA